MRCYAKQSNERASVCGSRAGYFASHWNGMILFGSGVLLASLLTLLLPLVVRLSGGAVALVILIRALIGFCEVCALVLVACGFQTSALCASEPSRHLGAAS